MFKVTPPGEDDDKEDEDKELKDDELNELLARGDDEMGIFTQMDIDRNAAKLNAWHAAGNTGPVPPPLMDKAELPAFYRRDLGAEMAAAKEVVEDEGRGRRKKTDVQYTDNLTDEQFARAVEASDDDLDDAVERQRNKTARMKERKLMNAALEEAEAEGKPLVTASIRIKQIKGESEGPETPQSGSFPGGKGKGKKRARPSESATPSAQGDEFNAVSLFIHLF